MMPSESDFSVSDAAVQRKRRRKDELDEVKNDGERSSRAVVDDKRNDSSNMQAFLSSMTFAAKSTFAEFCDCDEPNCTRRNVIPADVASAIEDYKQKRRFQMNGQGHNDNNRRRDGESSDDDDFFRIPLTFKPKITQTRDLVWRLNPQFAIWRWRMPVDAEPLIEYGNNHRIIYVKHLPSSSCETSTSSKLVSIGKGVFGSSEEEKNRQDTKWKQGRLYIVPSNGGKALGWIHKRGKEANEQEESTQADEANSSNAELMQIKVDPQLIEDRLQVMEKEHDDISNILSMMKKLFEQSDDEAFEITSNSDIALIMSFLSKH